MLDLTLLSVTLGILSTDWGSEVKKEFLLSVFSYNSRRNVEKLTNDKSEHFLHLDYIQSCVILYVSSENACEEHQRGLCFSSNSPRKYCLLVSRILLYLRETQESHTQKTPVTPTCTSASSGCPSHGHCCAKPCTDTEPKAQFLL